jgi:hypothetical protein
MAEEAARVQLAKAQIADKPAEAEAAAAGATPTETAEAKPE